MISVDRYPGIIVSVWWLHNTLVRERSYGLLVVLGSSLDFYLYLNIQIIRLESLSDLVVEYICSPEIIVFKVLRLNEWLRGDL